MTVEQGQDEREVIPRWRLFESSTRTGELDALLPAPPQNTESELGRLRGEYEQSHNSFIAGDLLSADLVLAERVARERRVLGGDAGVQHPDDHAVPGEAAAHVPMFPFHWMDVVIPIGLTAIWLFLFARQLRAHGADLLHVVSGQTTPRSRPEFSTGFNAAWSDLVRNEARGPVMTSGNLPAVDDINHVLLSGRPDVCVPGKPLPASPAWLA